MTIRSRIVLAITAILIGLMFSYIELLLGSVLMAFFYFCIGSIFLIPLYIHAIFPKYSYKIPTFFHWLSIIELSIFAFGFGLLFIKDFSSPGEWSLFLLPLCLLIASLSFSSIYILRSYKKNFTSKSTH